MFRPPTEKQYEILRFIVLWQAEHNGTAPTIREMAVGLSMKRSTVVDRLAGLRRKSLIVANDGEVRAMARNALSTRAGRAYVRRRDETVSRVR